jgi:N-acetylglucosamine kinase-like BadF-type ATPase
MEKIRLSPVIARDIFQLAADGDETAEEVIRYCASELGQNTNAVIRQLNLQDLTFDVVLIGSVFKAGEIYVQPFRETIHDFAPGAHLILLSVPPVVGSVLLAAEAVGLQNKAFRPQLLQSMKTRNI